MRITLYILAGFLVIAGGGLFYLTRTMIADVEKQYSQASEEPLVDFSHLFASLIEQDVKNGKIDPSRFRTSFRNAYRRKFLAKIYQLRKTTIQTHVYVTDKEGIVIFDSENGKREGSDFSRQNDVYLVTAGGYGARSTRTDPADSRTTVFYIAAPIYDSDGNLIGTLTVSRPETAMAPFADQARALLLKTGLATGLFVALLGALWIYLLLHPISSLTKHARDIASGDLSYLPVTGRAELKSLSRAIENMRHELEGKHYVENYVQALTHELKSPLAGIRGAAELMHEDEHMSEEQRQRFLSNILAESSRSEELIRRLVQLAALESQNSLAEKQTIHLPRMLTEELKSFAPVIEAKKLRLICEGLESDSIQLEGDPLMLRIAIRNLLHNAIDFSSEGGVISMACAASEEGYPTVTIKDEGPGIPDYAEDKLFDRFYSLKNQETGRKGSGIGLCFVKEAMKLHGGSAVLRNREKNRGAEAILMF